MAMAMPQISPFDPHGDTSSTSIRWERWLSRFNSAMVGFDITTDKRKRALLLHFGGADLHDVFDTLPNTGAEDDFNAAVTALTTHFTPKQNIFYETIKFQDSKQESNESVSDYVTRLRQLAIRCKFTDVNREICIQLLKGCSSATFRRKAMEKERTLDKLLELAHSLEITTARLEDINPTPTATAINKMTSGPSIGHRQTNQYKQNTYRRNSRTCYLCGGEYPHKNRCPAEGKECSFCGKLNHFAKWNKQQVLRTHTLEMNW
ncbi:uncharacterized protein [Amphiura filiformis]|uniref:uncharacterized protein n=1 Tax=Amphiura filiformis TaxID=82378 RepID=UPI003B213732